MMHTIQLTINNQIYERQVPPSRTLLEFLRDDLDLIGAKEGCGNGECGACTVLLDNVPVRSCLILAVETNGSSLQTIEGLAATDRLHPLQQAFIETGAVQCDYCAPGFLIAAYALLQRSPSPSLQEIDDALSGHLCRCTGYESITQAIQLAAQRLQKPPPSP